MNLDVSVYRARRERVYDAIGNGVALLFAAPERMRSNDTEYPYRQDSYFYYLSGLTEPEAVMILDGASRTTTLCCRPKDPDMETWLGFRYGPDLAAQTFGFEAACNISEWQQRLQQHLYHADSIYALWQHDGVADAEIVSLWRKLSADVAYRKIDGNIVTPAHVLGDLYPILDEMRLIKDAHEITLLRTAAQLSAEAHNKAMQAACKGVTEYQLEAEILYHFMRNNARSPSYNSIIAAGKNACTLHYVQNNAVLQEGQLVLIDAGAEYGYYAGDITRTFPVNGQFTGAQKAVYEIVLEANKQAIAAIAPHVLWQEVSDVALNILVQGMVDLKLLHGNVEDNIASQAYRRFYMHGIGHWIGLDVHDVGGRFHQGQARKLRENMCTTVEPGLYIQAADDIPPEFHNIGIRIEDNVRVSANAAEVYTTATPKEIGDIEALMRENK